MKNKKGLIKVMIGLIVVLTAYFVFSGYTNDPTTKDNNIIKKDLYGEIVGADEYGIVDGVPIVDAGQLLPTDTWQEFVFDDIGLVFRYPEDQPQKWWVRKNENTNLFTMTTSESGEPNKNSDWVKITFGLYERTQEQSIFDWMESPVEQEGMGVPPSDRTVQYVMIGESKFLGSVSFKDHIQAGQKNVYAELSPFSIFSASLEVQNFEQDSEFIGKFDQVFYTMLESLEVKSQ